MKFQSYHRIPETDFDPPLKLAARIRARGANGLSFELREVELSERELEEGRSPHFLCISTASFETPKELLAVFRTRQADLRLSLNALDNFPANYKKFIDRVRSELDAFTHQIFGALLWRYGLTGGPVIFCSAYCHIRWGEDESSVDEFGFLPRQIPQGISEIGLPEYQTLDKKITGLPETIEGSKFDLPPLAHELFREAWRNRIKHRRSSLVMSVAALETGFKTLAADLAPDAEWLLENIQSPPLEKMLRDFLPQLKARATFDGKVRRPSALVRTRIRLLIELRNKIVHGGEFLISDDVLKEGLESIRQLLYLFDYYSGFAWAADMLEPETLE